MKIQQELPYKGMQSDHNVRYALILTADAVRYGAT